jgi:hypothetical protein
VQLGVDPVPSVVVDRGGGQLNHEEDPLHGPAKDKVVNQGAGGLWMSEANGEPDAYAGDSAENAGEDEKEFGIADQLLEPLGTYLLVCHAQGLALGHGQIEASADGELRNHDMEDGDDADHPARAEIGNIPEWIVHL